MSFAGGENCQENVVIEIKQVSWSFPDLIFFKNKFPNPILIQKTRKYPSGYTILILSMLTSEMHSLHYHNGAVKVAKSAFYSNHDEVITVAGPIAILPFWKAKLY